jgi:hypothetical protein
MMPGSLNLPRVQRRRSSPVDRCASMRDRARRTMLKTEGVHFNIPVNN